MLDVLASRSHASPSPPGRRWCPTASLLNNAGPHGLSEICTRSRSAAGNNGFGLRGDRRQNALVQTCARLTMLSSAVPDDRPRPRRRRDPGRKRSRCRLPGTLPTNGPLFRRAPRGAGPDRGGADLLPRPQPGPRRRDFLIAVRKGVLAAMSDERVRAVSAWEGHLLRPRFSESVRKLDRGDGEEPGHLRGEIRSVLTTLTWVHDVVSRPAGAAPAWFTGNVTLWLWFTVLFANFAEALAEGRARPSGALRRLRAGDRGRKLIAGARSASPPPPLPRSDDVAGRGGETIPGRRVVIEGIASVDESAAVTGEFAPVIRESGGRRVRRSPGHEGPLRPHRGPDRGRKRPASRSSTAMIALSRGGPNGQKHAERDRAHRAARTGIERSFN